MIDKFLKAKHWQLFLLTFGVPMIFQLLITGSMVSDIGMESNPDPMVMFSYMKFFPIMMIIFMGVFFCVIYSLYFVAKTFKTVELQREVKFSDFAGEFFMIWFYPIGIWIIQPKINKMIEG